MLRYQKIKSSFIAFRDLLNKSAYWKWFRGTVGDFVAFLVVGGIPISILLGIGYLWDTNETFAEFMWWIIALGVALLVLAIIVELAPLIIALAALVYLYKNC